VISGNSTVIQCVAGAPASGSAAIADDYMAYPQTQEGFRFKGATSGCGLLGNHGSLTANN